MAGPGNLPVFADYIRCFTSDSFTLLMASLVSVSLSRQSWINSAASVVQILGALIGDLAF